MKGKFAWAVIALYLFFMPTWALSTEMIDQHAADELDRLTAAYYQEMLGTLEGCFGKALTKEERVFLNVWIDWADRYTRHSGSEWDAFEAAVRSCTSADALRSLLSCAFIGITEAPEGSPKREEIEATARQLLADKGYSETDFPYAVAMHRGVSRSGQSYGWRVFALGETTGEAFAPRIELELSAQGELENMEMYLQP